jgi:hypothetical protein
MTLFLVLFTVCEVFTPLIVEGLKTEFKGLGKNYNATLIALFVAIFVSGVTGVFTYLLKGIDFTVINVFYILFLMLANWLGSTLGYDKLKQAFASIGEITKETK